MDLRNELRAKLPKTFAARDKGSYRAAVRLQCLECVGGSRLDVRDCTDCDCPLYLIRPYKTEAEEQAKAALIQRSPAQLEADRRAGERLNLMRKHKQPS